MSIKARKRIPIYWAKAGEIATFTIDAHIDCAENQTKKFLMAILVPKSWNARENTTVTYTATGKEDGVTSLPMSPVNPQLVPKKCGCTLVGSIKG